MTYTDPQTQPRLVPSDKWPPLFYESPDPVPDVRVIANPAADHVEQGRAQVVRFANESSVALAQLRSWLRADRNNRYERRLGDVLYDIEGILEAYDPEVSK